jgi:Arc/MetJ family transcription regulator
MKTTIEIGDDLLAKARRAAVREGKTLREFVEEALRQRLSSLGGVPVFRLRKHAFTGRGCHPLMAEGHWETVRDYAYRLG